MNYFLSSRLVYAIPFLLYMVVEGKPAFQDPECFVYAGFWTVILLFSLFFFGIRKKSLPRPLVHFIFLSEIYIYFHLAALSGRTEFLFFILPSAFYAVDSLRNSLFSISISLAMFAIAAYFIGTDYGLSTIDLTNTTLCIMISPLVCRALMSVIDDRDVLIRETTKNKEVFVAIENTEDMNKLTRKMNFFKMKSKRLKEEADKAKKDKEKLEADFQTVRSAADKKEQLDYTKQQINQEIARAYFALLANIRFDLSQSVDDNLGRMIQMFMRITKSQYAAIITKEPPTEPNESYSLALTNSCNMPEFVLQDEQIIENRSIWDKIIKSIEENKSQFVPDVDESVFPVKCVIITPVSAGDNVKGVLVQGFGENFSENIHNFNMSLMVAYHVYSVLENESLYKQAKDDSSIDPLIGIFNKKYMLNSLEVVFNNAYNYATNLACVFVGEDQKQDEEYLRYTADVLKRHIRKSDMLFHYSENSFAVLFNGVSKEKISGFLKEINDDLAQLPTPITVSMGASIYDPMIGNIKNGKELMNSAGNALYLARKSGTSRIHIAQN